MLGPASLCHSDARETELLLFSGSDHAYSSGPRVAEKICVTVRKLFVESLYLSPFFYTGY